LFSLFSEKLVGRIVGIPPRARAWAGTRNEMGMFDKNCCNKLICLLYKINKDVRAAGDCQCEAGAS
jgi:hypothetical protein